ncbi:hypothetical protein BG653_06984 [Streptomyces platensis]|uniref:Uncharacterized protein n=2 Tax=Streptomyces platensis TaxID=58346 RepID=A0ABX3XMN0_STRPT|nr:hypothetical protein [Streptomyces platensis]OSY35959.1 hypothetical protein BG653_06984 [Streptomyces platensis]
MSDTTTEATTTTPSKAPESATTTAEVDGASVPIEFTLTQAPAEETPTQTRATHRLRALPAAVFGVEALSTGSAALYSATGLTGALTAAGVVVGGAALTAAGVATAKSRSKRSPGRVGGFHSGGLSGAGRSHRASSGAGSRSAGAGGIGRQRRGSALGASSTGASTPRTPAAHRHPRRGGAGQSSMGTADRHRSSAGKGASAGRGAAGSGKSGGGQHRPGGAGGLLSRLAGRQGGTTGPASKGLGGGGGSLSKSSAGRSQGARSTVAAATGRAARTAARGVAAAGRKAAGAWGSPRMQSVRDAVRSGYLRLANQVQSAAPPLLARLGERIRSARRALAKRGRAAVPFLLRAASAGLLAGALGALVAVPGLILRGVAATCGGVLRWLHLAPRSGKPWGARFTRWGPKAATWAFAKLMRSAKDKYAAAVRPDVLTDFAEPGRRATAGPGGAFAWPGDHFGGNLVSVFQRETEGVRDAYARYEPPMMLAVAAEYWGLPEGLTSTGEAIRQLAVNVADKYPADARMADLVAQVYSLLHQAAQKAAEVGPLFAKVHEHDLRRYEEPRPGEHMWNILERRQDGSFSQRQPSHFVAVTQDVAHVYARYEPGHMKQVAAEFEGIPGGIENVAAAVQLLQVRSNERYPVDKAVVDALADVHMLLLKAASAAQDLMPNFRRLHAPDISRHEAPRNGEESEGMWDV